MEPANVNLPPDDEAHLAALLRRTPAELPDDGFSARVLAALPPPARRSVPLLEYPLVRALAFSLAALAGLVFAIFRGLSLDSVHTLETALLQTLREAPLSLSDSSAVLAFTFAALSILYAMKDRLSRSL